MKTAYTYLTFDGNAEEAFTFYRSVFGGELSVIRVKDMPGSEEMSEDLQDKVANVTMPLGEGTVLMGMDATMGQPLAVGNNVHIFLEADSEEEAERIFRELATEGKVDISFDETPWAEKFGICVDRFGVQWMVNYTGTAQFNGNGEKG